MTYINNIPFLTYQDLKKSTRSYDFAVSLGTACIVASKMENSNLRLFSGPFDWTVGSPEKVHYLIKSNFKDFFLYDNLRIEGKRDGKFLVRDELNSLLSVHDFKETGNRIDKSGYTKVIEKYKRRIERFYEWCSLSEKALFVIFINSEESFSDIYKIKETIQNRFSQLRFDILIICLRPEKLSEIKMIDDCIYLAYIYHDESNWSKSDLHWKEILNHFSIDFSQKTIDLSKVSYLDSNRVSFKSTEISNKFVYLGLSHPEPHGSWSIGDKTSIGLRLKTRPKTMTIKCFSYKNRSSLVYLNGKCIGTMDFTTNSHSQEFDLKNIDIESDYSVLDIIHETPISPLSVGESSDSRKIAVCFEEILFLY